MSKNSEQPASWRAFTKQPSRRAQPEEPVTLDFGARAQDFLKRITRQAPGTSFEPYPIPVLADPKKIIQALDVLRSLKSFPSPAAVNTTTGPQLPKYVSAAFGSLDLPWKPGHRNKPMLQPCAVSGKRKRPEHLS
jgi:hypothetical protein